LLAVRAGEVVAADPAQGGLAGALPYSPS